jgi:hypothetical protein
VPGAQTVVCLMHPRQDVTHHPLVPLLLQAGVAVWTQHPRSVNSAYRGWLGRRFPLAPPGRGRTTGRVFEITPSFEILLCCREFYARVDRTRRRARREQGP